MKSLAMMFLLVFSQVPRIHAENMGWDLPPLKGIRTHDDLERYKKIKKRITATSVICGLASVALFKYRSDLNKKLARIDTDEDTLSFTPGGMGYYKSIPQELEYQHRMVNKRKFVTTLANGLAAVSVFSLAVSYSIQF